MEIYPLEQTQRAQNSNGIKTRMKLINPDGSETRTKLTELKPIAKEALEIMTAENALVERARQLALKTGGAEQLQSGRHPFAYCETLLVTYGQLSLEAE